MRAFYNILIWKDFQDVKLGLMVLTVTYYTTWMDYIGHVKQNLFINVFNAEWVHVQ